MIPTPPPPRPSLSLLQVLAVLAFALFSASPRLGAQAATATPALATAVVYNSASEGGATLAKFYAKERGIPTRQVIGIDMPNVEEIPRAEYENKIAKPLLAKFEELGLVSYRTRSASGTQMLTGLRIRYLVLIRGVPLKIAREPLPAPPEGTKPPPATPFTGVNEASVDSELTCALVNLPQTEGPAGNPYFKAFTPILEATTLPPMLLVCRLDAVTDQTVFRMIRDSLETEKIGRLWGRAWVDSRGIVDGGYAMGDDWMRGARKALDTAGLPVIWDERDATFPPGTPVSDCAFYLGWYDWNAMSPWSDPDFRFHKGAVAAHLHSFSAATIRAGAGNWVGPLLEHGAAATLGNVYEPYLHLTTQLDVLTQRLLGGFTFGEAFYMAQPALSWMAVAVGDPLYRPFPKPDDLMAATADPPKGDRVYAKIVELNDVWKTSTPPDATQQWAKVAEAAKAREAAILWEALALKQAAAGDYRPALISIAKARAEYKDALDRARCLILESGYLAKSGQAPLAIDLLRDALKESAYAAQAPALTFYLNELAPPPPPPPPPTPPSP